MLGLAGAGKGTQGQILKDELSLSFLSSGDLFRHHQNEETDLGMLAKNYMKNGQLVPDEITINMILDGVNTIGSGGFVLDGFPRTLSQAEALDKALIHDPIDCVVYIMVNEDELLIRLTDRLICRSCGAPYSKRILGPIKDCGRCGGQLYKREDDKPEVIKERLKVQLPGLHQLVGYYADQDKLVEVNGNQSVADVSRETLKAVSEIVIGNPAK
mgnify:FL=1